MIPSRSPNLKDNQENPDEELSGEELEFYGDDNISSADARVPRWLKWTYIFLPIWGAIWLFFFFNGSYGWLDAGYWNQLQKAALTTFPSETIQQQEQSPP